jgi:hypothetical protein
VAYICSRESGMKCAATYHAAPASTMIDALMLFIARCPPKCELSGDWKEAVRLSRQEPGSKAALLHV